MTGAGPATCVSPLRWAGGKRKLLPLLNLCVPNEVDRVIDPFVGGGSVLLGLAAREGIGADTNAELVNFYEQCRTSVDSIMDLLRGYGDDRDTYTQIRASSPSEGIPRAARFLYLNRTAYFGLWRTNQLGGFNVPYGGGGRLNLESIDAALKLMRPVLERVEILHEDYLSVLASVRAGDVVFLDPPYGAQGDYPFRRYGSLLFTRADHKRLAAETKRCADLGASVFVTLPPDDALLAGYEGCRIVGERRRADTKLLEVCLASDGPAVLTDATLSGWKLVANGPIIGEDAATERVTGTSSRY